MPRWTVEVLPLGGGETAKHTVDADSWLSALGRVQSDRREPTSLADLSLEIRAEGGQAIDAARRRRYVVTKSAIIALAVHSSREEPPTAERPLLYRELTFVSEGIAEADAGRALLDELREVREELQHVAERKFVAMAVFDGLTNGKQVDLPVATLVWKDWRGEPLIVFPRRGDYAPPSMVPAALGGALRAPAPAPATLPPPGPTFSYAHAPSSPAPLPAAVDAHPTDVPPPVVASATDVPPPIAASPTDVPPPIVAPPTDAPPPIAASLELIVEGDPSLELSPRFSQLPPPADPTRVRLVTSRPPPDDLLDDLFDVMQGLYQAADSAAAARVCLAAIQRVSPVRQATLHAFAVEKREFVAIASAGEAGDDVLLGRVPSSDPLLGQTAKNRRAMIHFDVPETKRFGALPGLRTALTAPALAMGRVIAVFELVDPADGGEFNDGDAASVTYIAERFGEFVASNGLVFDAARVFART